jgi:ketosteroid isomerase-like protein
MSAELKDLSRAYVAAFNARNAPGCAALMADDFALEDPVVKRVEGKEAAMRVVEGYLPGATNSRSSRATSSSMATQR